jgi:hypothetical protein
MITRKKQLHLYSSFERKLPSNTVCDAGGLNISKRSEPCVLQTAPSSNKLSFSVRQTAQAQNLFPLLSPSNTLLPPSKLKKDNPSPPPPHLHPNPPPPASYVLHLNTPTERRHTSPSPYTSTHRHPNYVSRWLACRGHAVPVRVR